MAYVSSLNSIVTRSAKFVNHVLFGRANLLLTNCVISTAMGCLGDSIQQHYDLLMHGSDDGKSDKNDQTDLMTTSPSKSTRESTEGTSTTTFNWTRNVHMGAAGFTTGLISHFWYIFLDKKLGTVRSFSIITQKVLLDQIIFSPVNWIVYFSTVGLCERSTIETVTDEIIEKGMQQIYVAEWFIWPPAQYFNFYCLPLRYRILFDNVISLGFDIYSPYVKYKTELKKEREAKMKQKLQTNETVISNLTPGE